MVFTGVTIEALSKSVKLKTETNILETFVFMKYQIFVTIKIEYMCCIYISELILIILGAELEWFLIGKYFKTYWGKYWKIYQHFGSVTDNTEIYSIILVNRCVVIKLDYY